MAGETRTRDVSYAIATVDPANPTGAPLIRGRDVDARQDPASTTKLWTLYTLTALQRDGVMVDGQLRRLPEGWMEQPENRRLIERMMIRSDNNAAQELASRAATAVGLDGRVTNDGLDIVPGFARIMNETARAQGLTGTNFVTVSGMNHPEHYSTAGDVARMMFEFRRDYPQMVDLAGIERSSVGTNTGATEIGSHGIKQGKTGTATGNWGSTGRYAFVGATDNGTFAVLGAHSKSQRRQITFELADSTRTGAPLTRAETIAGQTREETDAAEPTDGRHDPTGVSPTGYGWNTGPRDLNNDGDTDDEGEREGTPFTGVGADEYQPTEGGSRGFMAMLLAAILSLFGLGPERERTQPEAPAAPPPAAPTPITGAEVDALSRVLTERGITFAPADNINLADGLTADEMTRLRTKFTTGDNPITLSGSGADFDGQGPADVPDARDVAALTEQVRTQRPVR